MSSKEEQVKKNMEEERRKQEDFAKEVGQLRKEDELRKLAAQTTDKDSKVPLEKENTTRFTIQDVGAGKSDWQKIIADYQKKYPDYKIEKNTLVFPSLDDAVNFFNEQATMDPPRKFLASEVDENGKLTGFNLFSCGDGHLYKGTLNEIHEQLKAAQKEQPDDPNLNEGIATISRMLKTTHDFRSALQNTKPESESEHSSTPNPLDTRPKIS